MYVAFNNGFSVRSVDPEYEVKPGEILFDSYPSLGQLTEAFSNYIETNEELNTKE
jgi:hypothetical protein